MSEFSTERMSIPNDTEGRIQRKRFMAELVPEATPRQLDLIDLMWTATLIQRGMEATFKTLKARTDATGTDPDQ